MKQNKLYISFPAFPENERLARMIAAAFLSRMNPTLEELDDVKTAVSEAVTNCIIHAYEKDDVGDVELVFEQNNQEIKVTVKDYGKGIDNIALAMEPLYTTKPEEERSGMGFSFMEAFMNSLTVESKPGEETVVKMKKYIGFSEELQREEKSKEKIIDCCTINS